MNGYSKMFILSVVIVVVFVIVYFSAFKKENVNKVTKELSSKINNINNYISDNNIDIGEKINVPLYYINLDRSEDRREELEKQLEGTSVKSTRIPGIDGKKINLENKTYTFGDGRVANYDLGPKKLKFSKSELGCTFSHLHAIKTAYENGDELALIVEDDIFLNISSQWKMTIMDVIKKIPDDWGIIQLHTEITKRISKCDFYVKWDNNFSACSYLVNRNFMKIISDLFDEERNIKIEETNDILADFFIYNYGRYKNLECYTVKPLFISNNVFLDSTIHTDHTYLHLVSSRDILNNYYNNCK